MSRKISSNPWSRDPDLDQANQSQWTCCELVNSWTCCEPRDSVKIDMSSADTYTVGHAIDALGFGPFQWLLSLAVGLAFVADAMEMMILSVMAPALHCHWEITQIQQASLTTVVFLGKKKTFLQHWRLTWKRTSDLITNCKACSTLR